MKNVKVIDFNNYRRDDGTIDLKTVYRLHLHKNYDKSKGLQYLEVVQELFPINSRQAAALAIATALFMDADLP